MESNSTPLSSGLNPPPVPAVVKRKQRTVLGVGIAATVLFLLVLGGGAVVLLRQSSPEVSLNDLGSLPDNEASLPTPDETAAVSASPSLLSPSGFTTFTPALLQLAQQEQNNLAVTIRYQREPQFTLTLESIERTYERPTLEQYEPLQGGSYSLLRLRGADNAILREEPFNVATQVLGEEAAITVAPIIPLSESVTYLVVAINPAEIPTALEIVSPEGVVLTQKSFAYAGLPQQALRTPAIDTALLN
ncbi:MAG: hypothetical protein WEA04_04705 [Candidatus Andersenbacteria bacterium]